MIDLHHQEQDPLIAKLREALQRVPCPTRTEEQWAALERDLFARLDRGGTTGRILARGDMFRTYFRPVLAAAAVLVLALNVFIATRRDSSPAVHTIETSAVLDIEGAVDMVESDATTPLSRGALSSIRIREAQRFVTRENAALTVQLSDGTGLRLAQNSELSVVEAAGGRIGLYLHRGDVLFSVKPLNGGREFRVATPNAECRVVGTIFQVSVMPGETDAAARTDLSVYQGVVRISDTHDRRLAASVETGRMVSLSDHEFKDVFGVAATDRSIRDISLLKLALDMAADTMSAPKGLIEVRSTPSQARVVINDQVMGTTPLLLRYPSKNPVDIALSLPGYESWQTRLSLEHMRTTVVEAQLEPAPRPTTAAAAQMATQQQQEEYEGIVNRPEYIEALIQMNVGEYRKALRALETLRDRNDLSLRDRAYVMEQTSLCYRSLGDFRKALRELQRKHRWEEDAVKKSNLLWEIAMIDFTCLGDYKEAEAALMEYIEKYPEGSWAEQAQEKLVEVQYMLELSATR